MGMLDEKNGVREYSYRENYKGGSKPHDKYSFINGNETNQSSLRMKISNKNALITDSPKLEMLLERKNGMEGRSSLLEGMKGIVNIKNSQILKLNLNDNRLGKNGNRRPSYNKI